MLEGDIMTTAIYRANRNFGGEVRPTAPRVAEWGPECRSFEYGSSGRVRTLSPLVPGIHGNNVQSGGSELSAHRTKQRASSKGNYGAICGGALFGLFIVLGSFLFGGDDSDPYLSGEMSIYGQTFDTSIR